MSTRLLTVTNLSKDFGGIHAVNDVSFHLEPDEILGIIGPNGAGKTTAVNLISGLARPTSGKIQVGGQNLTGHAPYDFARQGVARTFQNIRLFTGLTVLDNVLGGMHLRIGGSLLANLWRGPGFRRRLERAQEEALRLLETFGLRDRAGDYPGELPYGQQRRLEIARALAGQPRMLFLDEPAAGMNPVECEELVHLIRRVAAEFTISIILIEHHMDVVMSLCQRILVLDHGEMIAAGMPEAVQRDPRVIEVYLGGGDDHVNAAS